MEIPKAISRFKFKSTTASNDPSNSVITVFENGVTYIVKRVMTKKIVKKDGLKLLAVKFGYNIYEEHFAIKYSSLMTIAGEVTKIAKEHNLKNIL